MTKPTTHIKFPLLDILNIFQLGNANIFEKSNDTEITSGQYGILYTILDFFDAKSVSILSDAESIDGYSISVATNEKYASFFQLSLKRTNEAGQTETWLFLAMSLFPNRQDVMHDANAEANMMPVFVLTGTIEDKQFFRPQECIARKPDDGDDYVFSSPDDMEDYYAHLLYADSFFLSLVTDEETSLERLATHLDKSREQASRYKFDGIRGRTSKQLAKHILDYMAANGNNFPAIPHFPAPSIVH